MVFFKTKPKQRVGFILTIVLVFKALTKLIMDMVSYSYEEGTGIGFGIGEPTKTSPFLLWSSSYVDFSKRVSETFLQHCEILRHLGDCPCMI